MPFHTIDGYLLDGRPSKSETIAALLRERVAVPAALPFYRALEAVGERAADEALIALRLVIAGRPPADDAVRRLRGLATLARHVDHAAQTEAFAKAGDTLSDLSALRDDPPALAAAARAAYGATF
jgi:hypothetical protein